jgi:hypothetical protein
MAAGQGVGGQGQRDVTQPQELGRVATRESSPTPAREQVLRLERLIRALDAWLLETIWMPSLTVSTSWLVGQLRTRADSDGGQARLRSLRNSYRPADLRKQLPPPAGFEPATPALGVQFAEPLNVPICGLTCAAVFRRLSSVGDIYNGLADYLRTLITRSRVHCAQQYGHGGQGRIGCPVLHFDNSITLQA